jgi:hypothetical protein
LGLTVVTNIQFQFYSKAPAATLSGGAWQAGAPLANLLLDPPLLSLRARSSNLLLASTKFNIDLGASNIPVRMIGVARHNLTRDALARITAGTTPGGTDLYSTGWIPVWPAVYLPEDLEWEDDNFWTGQLSDEEIVGYPSHGMHDALVNIRARYWTIEINDAANPDGYVELAHLRLGTIWSPERNLAPGAQLVWEDRTVSATSLGGVLYSETRPPARVLRLALKGITRVEAFGALLDAQRLLGTHTPFWVVPSPDDVARRFKRDCLVRFRKLDPITQAFHNVHETVLELEEWL